MTKTRCSHRTLLCPLICSKHLPSSPLRSWPLRLNRYIVEGWIVVRKCPHPLVQHPVLVAPPHPHVTSLHRAPGTPQHHNRHTPHSQQQQQRQPRQLLSHNRPRAITLISDSLTPLECLCVGARRYLIETGIVALNVKNPPIIFLLILVLFRGTVGVVMSFWTMVTQALLNLLLRRRPITFIRGRPLLLIYEWLKFLPSVLQIVLLPRTSSWYVCMI